AESFVCAEGADLERLDRFFQIVDRTGGRREMQDVVECTFAVNVIRDVVFDEREPIAADQMLDIRGTARDQVVHADHFMAAIEEQLAQMGAEEPRPTRDQGTPHQAGSFRPTETYVKPSLFMRCGS